MPRCVCGAGVTAVVGDSFRTPVLNNLELVRSFFAETSLPMGVRDLMPEEWKNLTLKSVQDYAKELRLLAAKRVSTWHGSGSVRPPFAELVERLVKWNQLESHPAVASTHTSCLCFHSDGKSRVHCRMKCSI